MTPHRDIEILKSLWGRSVKERWVVTAARGLPLTPLPGSDPSFFRFDSKIELMTNHPGRDIHSIFGSFGSTDFLLKQSIVPVVAWVDGDKAMRCIGTAYVISCTGYVITATHVLLDPVDRGYGNVARRGNILQPAPSLSMGVLMPLNPMFGLSGYNFYPFERSHFWGEWKESPLIHEIDRFEYQTDVAICKISELQSGAAHQPLHLSLTPIRVREKVYAIGYALMEDIPFEYRNGRATLPEFAHDIWVSAGDVMNVYPENHLRRDVPAPGPCFDFRAKIPGKMSGSPILGGDGAVVRGVVSRSFSGESHAFGAMLAPAMHLPLGDDRSLTLKALMDGGKEGIAKVQGPGL